MKICKQILSTVLVLAMLLSFVSVMAVSAETTAAVSFDIYEETVDEAAGVNTLVFKATVPAGRYTTCGLLFSFDNTAVELVNYETYEAVTQDKDGTSCALEPLSKWDYMSTATKVTEGRTYVKADSFYMQGTTVSAETNELIMTKVYFKYKENATLKKDTFKLESDYSEGSWLKEQYSDPADTTAAPLALQDADNSTIYTYGHASGTDAAPMALNSFEHSGTKVSNIRTITAEITPAYSYEDGVRSKTATNIDGRANSRFRYLVSKATLGITETVTQNEVRATAGTRYAGMILSGEIKVIEAKIDEDMEVDGTTYNVKTDELATYIKFEGLEVPYIQLRKDNKFGLEFSVADIIAHATEWKAWDNETGAAVAMPLSDLTADKFMLRHEWYSLDAVHTKGALEPIVYEYNVAPFTADTKFLSMQAKNVYADAVPANKWSTTTQFGWTFWNRPSTVENGNVAGPYQIFVPNFSGEYAVYGLKYGHKNEKNCKVTIGNNNHILFGDKSGDSSDVWSNFWSNASATNGSTTYTFTAGEPVMIMDITFKGNQYDQGGVLALAFVPVDQVSDVTIDDSTRKANSVITAATSIEAMAAVDFGSEKVASYNVTVKDYIDDAENPTTVTVSAKPYYRRSRSNGSIEYDYNANVFGKPAKYATLNDIVTQYLVENKGAVFANVTPTSIMETYQVYVNGVREYNLAKMMVDAGDVIEIKAEEMNSANFHPVNLGDKIHGKYYAPGGNVRFGISASKVNADSYPYLYTGREGTAGTYPTDGYFTGYLVRNAGDYAGQRVYLLHAALASKNNDVSGDKKMFMPNVIGFVGTNNNKSVDVAIEVETPEGTKNVLQPDRIATGDGVGMSWYDASNVYWVNSTVTADVVTKEVGDKTVITTDSSAMLRIITKKADGSTVTERITLTPEIAYTVDPAAGETVYVWKDTPYGGYSTIPLFAPFVGE